MKIRCKVCFGFGWLGKEWKTYECKACDGGKVYISFKNWCLLKLARKLKTLLEKYGD